VTVNLLKNEILTTLVTLTIINDQLPLETMSTLYITYLVIIIMLVTLTLSSSSRHKTISIKFKLSVSRFNLVTY